MHHVKYKLRGLSFSGNRRTAEFRRTLFLCHIVPSSVLVSCGLNFRLCACLVSYQPLPRGFTITNDSLLNQFVGGFKIVLACVCVICMPSHVLGQRTTFGSWFSVAMWVLAMEFKMSGLAADTFTCLSISSAPCLAFHVGTGVELRCSCLQHKHLRCVLSPALGAFFYELDVVLRTGKETLWFFLFTPPTLEQGFEEIAHLHNGTS